MKLIQFLFTPIAYFFAPLLYALFADSMQKILRAYNQKLLAKGQTHNLKFSHLHENNNDEWWWCPDCKQLFLAPPRDSEISAVSTFGKLKIQHSIPISRHEGFWNEVLDRYGLGGVK